MVPLAMNIVTFNDPFETAWRPGTAASILDGWRKSPLFEYEVDFERARKIHAELADKIGETWSAEATLPDLPYPIFRLAVKGGESWAYHMVVADVGEGKWHILIYGASAAKVLGRRVVIHMKDVCIGPMPGSLDNALRYEIGGFDVDQKKPLAQLCSREWHNRHEVEAVVKRSLIIVQAFAHDAMAPTNHIAEVRPNKEGKSVEWVKARTHYTLITHDHPANNKTVSHRARVESSPEKELERMAHNRRAHYRTLRHERYRFAKGRRIFVRSTWVGPKEWQDEGGRQIYKILDPVEESPEIYRFTK